ncbi:Leucine-rich repeat receptor protein kinase MSL1 [Vitis vinifera]|uniref:Leucine-rich repeat receptor protein kinase MSL1 n=1 Tax=Vitis vinifera TaxID=29760 RepID=A0A438FJI6_VITVI|nr:Leucine-rich repeat receptor protein kinase MSL1 [Vitis vinifera]
MERILVLGFILATLSLMTTEFACNGDVHSGNCLESDREALVDFKNGLKYSKNRFSSWKGSNCCHWEGINCKNSTGVVVSIDLHNSHDSFSDYQNWSSTKLSGEIRPSLKKLKFLRYLDLSGNSFDDISIPQFFGSLKDLQYLNLSNSGFSGAIPPNIGNLSNLQSLDLSSEFSYLWSDNLDWMAGLVSLKNLNMNHANLSMVGPHWAGVLSKLPILTDLHLIGCNLSGSISSLGSSNFSSLAILSISQNTFNSKFPEWLVNISSLVSIDISDCGLWGRVPLDLSELPNLQYLDLSGNKNLEGSCAQLLKGSWRRIEVLILASNNLHGTIPSSIGILCNLKYLNLGFNNLTGSLPTFLEVPENCSSESPLPNLTHLSLSSNQLTGKLPEWLGELEELVELRMDDNNLQGRIPASLGTLQHLTNMWLGTNRLKGTLPDSFGQLSELVYLDVSFNNLIGILSEENFSKLSKLKYLLLSFNSFTLNVSSHWVPPFQIHFLEMGSCHLGPSFPPWLKSQKEVEYLVLSNASISSSIPNWFWNISSNIVWVNLSLNHLQGQLPNPLNLGPFASIDFSSNLFQGPIPLPNRGAYLLDLSDNKFSGPIPQRIGEFMPELWFLSLSDNEIKGTIPASVGQLWNVEVIDLSRNGLVGSIPSTINNCSNLRILDLGNNGLSGMIPVSLGKLKQLRSLHLNKNKLSGELPLSFQHLSNLETLDLSYNKLSGSIPSWMGAAFSHLRILNLRSNAFSGELPSDVSKLDSLHVLDLAENHLTGTIPAILGDLKAMAEEQNKNQYLLYGISSVHYYEESLFVNAKGQVLEYTKTLSLVVSIDLSHNNLSGDFPKEITNLFGLVVLNLSKNHISGQIPESIWRLHQLLSFDLSSNKLSGTIPPSISSLTFLSYLNLSNNNFSGKIPFMGQMTTFTGTAFAGNPNLCGAPLVAKCQDEGLDKGQSDVEDETDDNFIDQWFYLSVGLGFAVGVLVPFFICTFSKSCYEVYFGFVNKIVGKLVWPNRRVNRS